MSSPDKIERGDRVRHKLLGEGEVIDKRVGQSNAGNYRVLFKSGAEWCRRGVLMGPLRRPEEKKS